MAQFKPQRAVYPLHTDNFQYMPDVRVQPGVLGSLKSEGRYPEEDMVTFKVAMDHKGPLYRKQHSSYNDPICIFYVADALLKVPRGHYVRPRYMIPYLRESFPQYYWSENSVGRIVAGIHGACKEMYDEHLVDPQTNEYDDKRTPFASGRDSKGRYYVIDPKGGTEGVLWLTALRSNAFKWSRLLMTAEANGDFENEYTGTQNTGREFVMEFAPDPIRGGLAYQSQLHPDRKFSYVVFEENQNEPVFA